MKRRSTVGAGRTRPEGRSSSVRCDRARAARGRDRPPPDRAARRGRDIASAEIVDPRLTRPVSPGLVADALVGERIAAVERRGKYLLWRLESGRTLVVHLRMTGSLLHFPAGDLPADAHRRATLALDTGAAVGYRDVRRFGTWELLDDGHLRPYLASRLGPEPLAPSFTSARLATDRRGAASADQGGSARPAQDRGHREHLRRRGALARKDPSAAPRRRARRTGDRAPASRGARGTPARCRAQRLDAPRLRDAGRRGRRDAARVSRVRTAWGAVRPLRETDRTNRRRRARHVALSALPDDVSSTPGPKLWTNEHEVGAVSFPIRLSCPVRL